MTIAGRKSKSPFLRVALNGVVVSVVDESHSLHLNMVTIWKREKEKWINFTILGAKVDKNIRSALCLIVIVCDLIEIIRKHLSCYIELELNWCVLLFKLVLHNPDHVAPSLIDEQLK